MTLQQKIQLFYLRWILKNMTREGLLGERDVKNIEKKNQEHIIEGLMKEKKRMLG